MKLTLSYYPWITQSIAGAELARAVDLFRALLEQELKLLLGTDCRLELLKALEVPDQLDEIAHPPSGDVAGKIGLLNPVGYAIVHQRIDVVSATNVVRRKIGDTGTPGPTYKAQIYTHRKTAIRKLEKIRGHTMAFGSPQSTSNFLVPAAMLWRAQIHPINGFSRVDFTGGHDKAAIAVYEGRSEVGAGHDGVIDDLANKSGYGDADQVLCRLAWSDPIPSDPVAVHIPDPDLRAAVQQSFLNVARPDQPDSDGNRAVYGFWGTKEGFETVAPDAYMNLLALMSPLGLRADDMLRRI